MISTRRGFLRTIIGASALLPARPIIEALSLFKEPRRVMVAVPEQLHGPTASALFLDERVQEDLLDVVTTISPTDSPLFMLFRQGPALWRGQHHEWLADEVS